jgi:septal ring factor EnvC (AmiA/AmiB activator)
MTVGAPLQIAVALLGALLLCGAAEPSVPSAAEQQRLEARLAEERQLAATLAAKETTLLGRLTELERQIEIEGRALRAAQAKLKASSGRLALAEQQVARAEAELQAATDRLGPRLLARYRLGREGYLRFLLGSRSIGEILRRKRLFTALLESDFAALTDLRKQAAAATAARDERRSAQQELAQSAAGEQEKRSALEVRVAVQKRTLAGVQQEKAAHEQAARELEQAAKALGARLEELSKVKPGNPAPPPNDDAAMGGKVIGSLGPRPVEPAIKTVRGKLLFPVGAGRIEARFGRTLDKRFGTVTLQRGVDIRSPEGTPVHAVHGGTVAHSGWFRGYGNLVILDHGAGWFSLYAHLATLDRAVGEQVSRGDPLGTVGDTGSLKGSYLYFELREGQKPLDPERWLGRVRKPGPLK